MKFSRLFAFTALLAAPSLPAVGESAPTASFREEIAALAKGAAEKNTTATPGLDGWLFLTAELRFLSATDFWGAGAAAVSRAPKPEIADPIPAIVDFNQQLEARGVKLLLVPVPPKGLIYPEKLLASAHVEKVNSPVSPLARFYKELAAQGVEVIDLSSPFQLARETSAEPPIYCKTDTHWSGAGCAVAAQAIGKKVRDLLGPASSPNPYTGEWTEAKITGDLASLLPQGTAKPAPEPVRLRQVKNTATGAAVAADSASPVLLMGDSHTLVYHEFAGERAGLLDQLALELGMAPDLIGTRGSGSTAVRLSLYRKTIKEPKYLAGKKVVVWCFTAREFTESDQGWGKLPVSK